MAKPPARAKINMNGNKSANVLDGNAQDNVLQGGGGNDTLSGGDGSDVFKFEKSLSANGLDTITDYEYSANGSEQDVLDLTSALKAFEKALERNPNADIKDYVWVEKTESGLKLMVDVDGVGGKDAAQWALLQGLTAQDQVRVRAFEASGSCSDADVGDGYYTLSVAPVASAAKVSSVALTASDEATYGTLNAGDKVTVTVTMDANTIVDTAGGLPRIALNIGGTTVYATYASGSGGTELTFEYTLQAGESDADGISIDADSLSANGGTLQDASGNDADLTHGAVAANSDYVVDTTAPTATITFDGISDDSGTTGDFLTNDDDGLAINATLSAALVEGEVLEYWNGTTWTAVTSTDIVGTAVSISDSNLTTTSTLKFRVVDAAGNFGVEASKEIVIDAEAPAVAPTVNTLSATSRTPTITGTATVGTGETLTVTVNGVTYTAGDGNLTLTGTNWELVIPAADALLADGTYDVTATITDAAGNATVDASADELELDATAPLIVSVALTAEDETTYAVLNAGDKVTVTVTMDENTIIDTTGGTPRIALNIGGATVYATYNGGSGSKLLTFEYTLQAGENDADGISVDADSLEANGGTLKDAAGNDADLTHGVVAANADYLVDTTAPVATISGDPQEGASNEAGGLYLVASTETITSLNDILALADDQFNFQTNGGADVKTALDITGLADGDYNLYAVDLAGNVSAASADKLVLAPDLTGGATIIRAVNNVGYAEDAYPLELWMRLQRLTGEQVFDNGVAISLNQDIVGALGTANTVDYMIVDLGNIQGAFADYEWKINGVAANSYSSHRSTVQKTDALIVWHDETVTDSGEPVTVTVTGLGAYAGSNYALDVIFL